MSEQKHGTATLGDLPALAQLKARMEAGRTTAPVQEPVANEPEAIERQEALVTPPAPQTPDEKHAARRLREIERKRRKRAEERLQKQGIIEPGENLVQLHPNKAAPVIEPNENEATPEEAKAEPFVEVTHISQEAHEAVADEMPLPVPTNKEEQAKRDLIESIVAYMPVEARQSEMVRLDAYETRGLKVMLEAIEAVMGDADDPLKELKALYAARISDPALTAAAREFEKMGGKYDKLATQLAKSIGSDVVINAMTVGEYRETARQAMNDLGVLKKMISDLEPALRYCQTFGRVRMEHPGDLGMPEPLAKLMWILRGAQAHLQTSVSRDQMHSGQLADLQQTIVNKDRLIKGLQEQLDASNRKAAEQFVAMPEEDTEVFVYCKTTRKFLASSMLPTGRNSSGVKVSLKSLMWTSDPAGALRFDNKAKALRTIDGIVEASNKLKPSEAPHVAGEDVRNIGLADAVIRLPTE